MNTSPALFGRFYHPLVKTTYELFHSHCARLENLIDAVVNSETDLFSSFLKKRAESLHFYNFFEKNA